MNQQPTIGRIVRYVLTAGKNVGQARAAIITNVEGDRVSLTALPDAGNDGLGVTISAITVPHDPEGTRPGSWHWPQP